MVEHCIHATNVMGSNPISFFLIEYSEVTERLKVIDCKSIR